MKTLITYYSFSGHTDNVAQIFARTLKTAGEVTLQRLKLKDEITSFAGQCRAAFSGRRADLEGNPDFDASHFDLIVIGSPVWAFAPVPAMNSFLDKFNGLHGKRVVILLTSGSGVGVGRCFRRIRRILESKGASMIDEINIPDRKQADTAFIGSTIEKYR